MYLSKSIEFFFNTVMESLLGEESDGSSKFMIFVASLIHDHTNW
jgi:hypothetical protein